MVFEFINKVLLPKSEKRTITSSIDLFLIECLSKFELMSLPALMIKHMHKVVQEKEERHGMPYDYLLNKVFNHFGVTWTRGTPGTVKQLISLTTLVENGCIEGKVGTVPQVFELLDTQESLTKEIGELRIMLAAKDTKIVHLKLHIQKLSSEGPGATEELAAENASSKKKLQN